MASLQNHKRAKIQMDNMISQVRFDFAYVAESTSFDKLILV